MILDESVALTGYHRKHAIRVLRDEVTKTGAASTEPSLRRGGSAGSDDAWEAADRVCGKRLKAMTGLVYVMERHGCLSMDPIIRSKVLQVNAATSDRMLAAAPLHIDVLRKRGKGVGSAIRRIIPVRTFADWRDQAPDVGYFQSVSFDLSIGSVDPLNVSVSLKRRSGRDQRGPRHAARQGL
ncbi:MAG: hypothetical protein ABI327_15880 [Burkholderiaceae bacterium]